MKTLDEVITAHEFCVNASITGAVCEECPAFAKPDCGIREDALHYLKEYREKEAGYDNAFEKMEQARKRYHEAMRQYITAHADLYAEESNDPLSWEQLRGMKGKPVWLEYEHSNHRGSGKRWFLIKWLNAYNKLRKTLEIQRIS